MCPGFQLRLGEAGQCQALLQHSGPVPRPGQLSLVPTAGIPIVRAGECVGEAGARAADAGVTRDV